MRRAWRQRVHLSESNLSRLGFCRACDLQRAGVNLAIGTGRSQHNDLDMFGEARSTALLAKAVAADCIRARCRPHVARGTLGGARALGFDHLVGSIESASRPTWSASTWASSKPHPCITSCRS